MEITWHNNSCFTIKNKDTTFVINPDSKAGRLKGDFVLSSLAPKEAMSVVEGSTRTFDWPGEYEIKDVPIVGFSAWTQSKSKEEEGHKGEKTIIFRFQVDGIKICHLGELGHTLTSDMLKEIGDVDVLMIRVGKNSNLEAKKASEIIEGIEPRIIIPMGDEDLEGALKGVWADKVETMDKFVIKSKAELPEDKTRCIVLNKC